MGAAEHDLPFRIDVWDERDRLEELVALVGDHAVAKAAFEEAVRRRPGRIVTLRQKTRLLAKTGLSPKRERRRIGGLRIA